MFMIYQTNRHHWINHIIYFHHSIDLFIRDTIVNNIFYKSGMEGVLSYGTTVFEGSTHVCCQLSFIYRLKIVNQASTCQVLTEF